MLGHKSKQITKYCRQRKAHKILINYHYWAAPCCLEAMTSASSGPAWALEGGHPLRPPLLPHLLLHPHCHLPPPGCISRSWCDEAHPCQSAHCLQKWIWGPDIAPRLCPGVGILPSTCSTNVCHWSGPVNGGPRSPWFSTISVVFCFQESIFVVK